MGSRRPWWLLTLLLLLTLTATGGSGCGSGGKNGLSPGVDSGSADGNGGSDSSLFGDGGQQLVVDPANPTLDVTGPTSTLQFSAHLAGNSTPLTATWTLDVAGLGTIDGTGLFTATGLLGGQAHVTAQVGSATGSTLLTVVLQLSDNPGNVPPATQMQLQGGGTADAAFKWLYPYDGTVFPRGLAAPVLQFAGTAPDATLVQVSFSSLSYTGFYGASNPGAVTLSPQLWQTITESASGSDTVKVSITKISSGQVTGPITEGWTIAQGSLKGTVYYNSYSSQLVGGGVSNGAVLSIKPGGNAQLLIGGQAEGQCTVCHAVSADGSTLIAAHPTPAQNNAYLSSSAYDLKNNAMQVYEQDTSADYAFGGLYPDGSLFMSLATFASSNDADYPQAPNVPGTQGVVHPAQLIETATGAVLPATGWDGVVSNSVTPMFSPDGTMIAFTHYDTGQGHTLATMSFTLATHTFAGLKDVASDPNNFLCWPAFSPDTEWLVYQTDNRADYGTWNSANSPPGTFDAQGDLYVVHLPSNTTARLDSVDGYTSGQLYLPYGTVEATLNFEPTVLPVAVGGYYWVVFTSRRDYGNTIVTSDQEDQPRKKLWVAALDIDNPEHPSTSAHDISHPAFYLPGQEEVAGNSRGFWALDPCQANGTDCLTGDQCCSGFCRQTTGADGGPAFECVTTPSGCSQEYEKCAQTSDCCACADSAPSQCIGGYCACLGAQ
jgi:WD40-like Beta Propeller Repeat